MAGTRIAFEGTYTSGTGTSQYRFTVVVDVNGVVSVRDIRTPYGLVMDSMTRLPQSVTDDIVAAMGQVEDLLSLTSSVNGTLTFSGEAEKSVTFSTPMSSTNYRVYLAPSDFVPARISTKLTTGFTVQLGVTFTGTVGYDVFV
jgi:hypothetical protein